MKCMITFHPNGGNNHGKISMRREVLDAMADKSCPTGFAIVFFLALMHGGRFDDAVVSKRGVTKDNIKLQVVECKKIAHNNIGILSKKGI